MRARVAFWNGRCGHCEPVPCKSARWVRRLPLYVIIITTVLVRDLATLVEDKLTHVRSVSIVPK